MIPFFYKFDKFPDFPDIERPYPDNGDNELEDDD